MAEVYKSYFPTIKAVVLPRRGSDGLKIMESVDFIDIALPEVLEPELAIKDFLRRFPYKKYQLEMILISAMGAEIPTGPLKSPKVILFAARDASAAQIHTIYYYDILSPVDEPGLGMWVPRGQEADYTPGVEPFENNLMDDLYKHYALAVSMPDGL